MPLASERESSDRDQWLRLLGDVELTAPADREDTIVYGSGDAASAPTAATTTDPSIDTLIHW